MKRLMERSTHILLIVALACLLAACSGNETPQGTSSAQPEDKSGVAQSQPSEPQAQPAEIEKAQGGEEAGQQDASQPEAAQKDAQSSETGEKTAEAMQPAESETAEITGTVMLSDAGVVIATDQGDYGVVGQDLTKMAGKTVNIIGTLEESDGRKMIRVTSVVEVQ